MMSGSRGLDFCSGEHRTRMPCVHMWTVECHPPRYIGGSRRLMGLRFETRELLLPRPGVASSRHPSALISTAIAK